MSVAGLPQWQQSTSTISSPLYVPRAPQSRHTSLADSQLWPTLTTRPRHTSRRLRWGLDVGDRSGCRGWGPIFLGQSQSPRTLSNNPRGHHRSLRQPSPERRNRQTVCCRCDAPRTGQALPRRDGCIRLGGHTYSSPNPATATAQASNLSPSKPTTSAVNSPSSASRRMRMARSRKWSAARSTA